MIPIRMIITKMDASWNPPGMSFFTERLDSVRGRDLLSLSIFMSLRLGLDSSTDCSLTLTSIHFLAGV